MTMLQHGLVPSTGGYQIERSLRFNSADSAYLNRTPASASNRKTWTWSGWFKYTVKDTGTYNQALFFARTTGATASGVSFEQSPNIPHRLYVYNAGWEIETTQVFRDPSAWYHIVAAIDNTQTTASNRTKLYINGVQVTALATATYPSLDALGDVNDTIEHNIGKQTGLSRYLDGYLTEINFIDGQALTPSSFGETDTDTGVWKPKAYSGSYGTNGFYLKFADNSGTTSTTLGKDSSGNGNNWTPNNFSVTAGAGNDSLVDTPTPYGTDTGAGGEVRGNYATFNPTAVSGMGLATLANGNLNASGDGTLFKGAVSTIAMSTSKWYWETTIVGGGTTYGPGIVASTSLASAIGGSYGYSDASDAWFRASNGVVYSGGAGVVTGLATFTTDDVISIAVDFDAGKLWFAKNGTWDSSGNPATGANPTITFSPGSKSFYAMVQGWVYAPYTWTMALNAGQRPFAYTAPSGYKALCTQNLPTPTIGATSTTQAGKYFNTVLYTGNTPSTNAITGVGFAPDFVWVKSRTVAEAHNLVNKVCGNNLRLKSNETTAEASATFTLDSDGFTVGANSESNTGSMVAWNWKANGAGSTNNAGSIQSTVSASTLSGFSIVTYTGNATAGATVGHGLGATPSMIIVKDRVATSGAREWVVYHSSLGNTQAVFLSTTGTAYTGTNLWNNTSPTSTVFTIGNSSEGTNGSGNAMLAYCFAPIAGYSAFGSYTGNGSADGPFVYLGFRPKYVLIKPTSLVDNWQVEDAARSPFNTVNDQLFPNTSAAEQVDSSTRNTDFLSNGFKIRGTNTGINTNGGTFIYAAFASNPFKYSLGA